MVSYSINLNSARHIIFINSHPIGKLSERQFAVLKLIVHGFSNKHIAPLLNIRERAIEKDRAKLIRVFKVHNSIELAAISLEHEIVKYEPDRYQWLWQIVNTNSKNDTHRMP